MSLFTCLFEYLGVFLNVEDCTYVDSNAFICGLSKMFTLRIAYVGRINSVNLRFASNAYSWEVLCRSYYLWWSGLY